MAGARGWDVIITYNRDEAAAERTIDDIRKRHGSADAVQANISVEADVLRIFKVQGLNGVVINAGHVANAATLKDMPTERLRSMFETNILGTYLCAREAVRAMPNGGAIVNVSSLAAKTGAPGEYIDYAGSKAAMDALTVGLAREVGPMGIRVNAVRPAFIDTEIHASSGNPQRAHILGKQTPLGRAGTAEEVAEPIIWLLSNAASYVPGAIVDVAGGR
jgi:NAD(P)-dependent dehydrogenase (short-subunit alcohol dehydrogenase family)